MTEPTSHFVAVRNATDALCAGLQTADFEPQAMADCSPVKWHLAHTTWFFEAFILKRFTPGYRPYHPKFGYLFNSYYNAMGTRHARPERGLLTRPALEVVWDYRAQVGAQLQELLQSAMSEPRRRELEKLVELGIHHEQQHQELILTDIKYLFAKSPLQPQLRPGLSLAATESATPRWQPFDGGLVQLGHQTGSGFAYDNEEPRHPRYLQPYALKSQPVTNAEFQEFIRGGGYRTPSLWLDQGYQVVCQQGWTQPLYWRGEVGVDSRQYTLAGEVELDPHEPVSHLSYFEADAFARFAGARLPTEAEWEHAVGTQPVQGNFVECERYQPGGTVATAPLQRAYGDAWEWTSSAYSAYPGYRAPEGAIGEYNGKFMCGQFVLRGGSCASSRSHLRSTYRNFFYPPDRWQFSGARLAKDL